MLMAVVNTAPTVALALAAALLVNGICWTPVLIREAHAQNITSEASFLSENDAAMEKMMKDMVIKPSGDVEGDFVAMMVPHHQGAIDMAQAYLRYGHNEQLRRLAQEIIVTQQQEIAVMRFAVGQPLPPSAPSPDQPQPATSSSPRAMPMHQEP